MLDFLILLALFEIENPKILSDGICIWSRSEKHFGAFGDIAQAGEKFPRPPLFVVYYYWDKKSSYDQEIMKQILYNRKRLGCWFMGIEY